MGEVKLYDPELPVMTVTACGDDERRSRPNALGAAEFSDLAASENRKSDMRALSVPHQPRGTRRR